LDVALEGGFVTKPSNGWYSLKGEEKKYRKVDTYTKDFWMPVLTSKDFREFIENRYQMATGDLMSSSFDDTDLEEEFTNASEV
jgi:hypothetical protein